VCVYTIKKKQFSFLVALLSPGRDNKKNTAHKIKHTHTKQYLVALLSPGRDLLLDSVRISSGLVLNCLCLRRCLRILLFSLVVQWFSL